MESNIHKEHRQRIKRQFLLQGASFFQEHQLVELLLYFGIPQGDTNPLAHTLLNRFGNIQNLLQATPSQLTEVKGVGEHTAVLICLCGALVRKCGEELRPIGVQLHSTEDLGNFLLPRYFGETSEAVYLLSINNRSQVLNCSLITRGSINATEIHTRRILQQALIDNATRVVISHCHPSGHAIPSKADIVTTTKLAALLAGADIDLVDHIIVADGDYVSMRDTPVFQHIFSGSL